MPNAVRCRLLNYLLAVQCDRGAKQKRVFGGNRRPCELNVLLRERERETFSSFWRVAVEVYQVQECRAGGGARRTASHLIASHFPTLLSVLVPRRHLLSLPPSRPVPLRLVSAAGCGFRFESPARGVCPHWPVGSEVCNSEREGQAARGTHDAMTRISRDLGGGGVGNAMNREAVMVSGDANFIFSRFPVYRLGPDNSIIELKDDPPATPSLKEIVARETIQLLEQRKRLSVRELAKKFEKGLTAVAKLSEEAKWREVASLDRHVLLKKLRDLLESLKGRVAGRNKDDVEEAVSMVEALAVQLTQREGELLHEKSEVKRLANFLKQATEDAKKVVEEERALARAEIENARESIQKVEQALLEQEKSKGSDTQSLDDLMKEVQEARRIKMLHQPSKVMDMEHELQALRIQLTEKSVYVIQLRKELELIKKSEESTTQQYELEGTESLGSYLQVKCRSDHSRDISSCSVQWFRVMPDGSKKELISGATKPVYAPEPFDVGRILQAEIILEDQRNTLATSGPIDPAPGLGNYVEALLRKSDVEFNVVVIQMNGKDEASSSMHVFHIGKFRIKLCKGRTTKAKEVYSSSMQLCGVRGGGNAAAQALFWLVRKSLSYTLAFESERERNAAIMLARRFAFDCNIMLAGPNDRAAVGL